MEFLIRRTDDEWFSIHPDQFNELLRPITFTSRKISGWGDHRIDVEGAEIAFSFEDPGVQVIFEHDIEPERARLIVDEICQNIAAATGQLGRVVEL